jgi:hypothetical protein
MAAGAAAGMAPGGTNPGGRCPKNFSYFQTSMAMYRSLSDLQTEHPLVVITIAASRHRAKARHHEFARIEDSPCRGHRLEAGHCLEAKQNYPMPEARQGKLDGVWPRLSLVP